MDIYQDKQVFDRTPGAVGAASDGMAPGQAYPAVVQTGTNSKGYCTVTIPALHLSYTFQAKTVSTVGVGTNVLVIFDQEKIPWVVTPTAGTPAVAMAYRSAAQTGIKSSTETRVQLDTVIKDPGNNFNVTAGNGFYTVPADGYYHIDGAVNLTTAEATYALIPYIRINGSPIPLRGAEAARHPGGGTSEIFQVTGIVFLKAGDKIELMVYQTSGTDKEIPTANEGYTRMSIMRVGEAGPEGKEGKEGGTAVSTSIATAYRNAEQKIPSGVFTRVKLDKAINDPGKNIDLTNGYYVVPAEGYYQVSGSVEIIVSDGAFALASIGLNGIEEIRGSRAAQKAEEHQTSDVSGVVLAKAGDKIELFAYHDAVGEKKLAEQGSSFTNRLSVARIGTGATGPPGPVSAEFVSALPSSPTDGKEIYYQNAEMAEKSIVWHLRYRAASTQTSKWEYVGGSPVAGGSMGETAKKKTKAEVELGGGPKVTVPLIGVYNVTMSLGLMGNEGTANVNEISATLRLNGVATTIGIINIYSAAWTQVPGSRTEGLSVNAGDKLTIGVIGPNNENSEARFFSGRIEIVPIRVG